MKSSTVISQSGAAQLPLQVTIGNKSDFLSLKKNRKERNEKITHGSIPPHRRHSVRTEQCGYFTIQTIGSNIRSQASISQDFNSETIRKLSLPKGFSIDPSGGESGTGALFYHKTDPKAYRIAGYRIKLTRNSNTGNSKI